MNGEEQEYKKHIKDYCVACGVEIPPTWFYYNSHGNYCVKCCGLAVLKTKEKIQFGKKVKLIFGLEK